MGWSSLSALTCILNCNVGRDVWRKLTSFNSTGPVLLKFFFFFLGGLTNVLAFYMPDTLTAEPQSECPASGSLHLDKCGLSQSASLCTPHRWRKRLKASLASCRKVLQRGAVQHQCLNESSLFNALSRILLKN